MAPSLARGVSTSSSENEAQATAVSRLGTKHWRHLAPGPYRTVWGLALIPDTPSRGWEMGKWSELWGTDHHTNKAIGLASYR